jgi:hypothetical protein
MTTTTTETAPRQRSPRTDPTLLDGDSAMGNVNETLPPRDSTDGDVGDTRETANDEGPDSHYDPAAVVEAADEEGLSAEQMLGTDDPDTHDLDHPTGNQAAPDRPITADEYRRMTVPQILDAITRMTPDQMREVRRLEDGGRKRKTLLVRLERLLREKK